MICKKVFFLAGLTLCSIDISGQVVTSAQNGLWNDASTWIGGVIPDASAASEIIVSHQVIVPPGYSVTVKRTTVPGELLISASGVLSVKADGLAPADLEVSGSLTVNGILICRDSAVIAGTTSANTTFAAGATYKHLVRYSGDIPRAAWHINSTFEIGGFTNGGYLNQSVGSSWEQDFGNVVYDCPAQATFVDLNGYLRNIRGNLVVRNTNSSILRMSTTQNPSLLIGGDVIIEGNSEVWFTTTGEAGSLAVDGDFIFRSTSAAASYFTTTGTCNVSIHGDVSINASGNLRLASGSGDGITALDLYGDLTIEKGKIDALPSGGGVITFKGTSPQKVSAASNSFTGNLSFVIGETANVDLGNSVLMNTAGSLHVIGVLKVGSTHPLGAIQVGTGGNIQINGERIYEAGSIIEYNGTATQFLGNGHPQTSGVTWICNNFSGIQLLDPATVGGDLQVVSGSINTNDFDVTVLGDITVMEDAEFNTGASTIFLRGGEHQRITTNGSSFFRININKDNGASVELNDPLELTGSLVIESENSNLLSNGYLVLRSTSDDVFGTASVGSLPAGSSVIGDVTVQRHMAGEGKIYRYITSPVSNATVASLMDDVPVTGLFDDPSTGPGISSSTPSLYYYDESIGNLAQGWLPYPTEGLAEDNLLTPGVGYAAFIREASLSTVWDVTGPLNQDTIDLPVQFTPGAVGTEGWNLVGNPYPCAIDWDLEAGWTKSGSIGSAIAVRDNGEGTFRYWDGEIGDLEQGRIAQGQAFWIRTTGANPVLRLNERAKTMEGADFLREAKEEVDYLSIAVSGNQVADKAYVRIKTGAAAGLDRFDAPKLTNDLFALSVSVESCPLAISAMDSIDCEHRFPLLFEFARNTKGAFVKPPYGNYILSIEANGVLKYATVLVMDRFTGSSMDISASRPYKFHITDSATSYASDRFVILVRYNDVEVEFSDGLLRSSYPGGNQWFFNDELLSGENKQTLLPRRAGVYKVRVEKNGCFSEAEYAFVPVSTERKDDASGIAMAPIPFREQLKITSLDGRKMDAVVLFSLAGKKIETLAAPGEICILDTRHLQKGVYVVYVKKGNIDHFSKVVK